MVRTDPKQDYRWVTVALWMDHTVDGWIAQSLEETLWTPGRGRLMLMYSQSTSGSTQPGERPVTARSGNQAMYRRHCNTAS